MSSPFSAEERETSTGTEPEDRSAASRESQAGPRHRLFGVLTVIVMVLLLKLGLTMGRALWHDTEPLIPTFPEEVLAEERKVKAQDPAAQKKPSPPPPPSSPPLAATAASSAMTDMVTHLEQREAEVKKNEEQLRQKEEYLSKMEQEVEKKLKELISIQKEIQAYHAEKAESQSAKIRSLAKIYGTMKPKEAAKLLENLEEQLVVNIISTMTADEAGNILGNMDIKKAAKISESLSHR